MDRKLGWNKPSEGYGYIYVLSRNGQDRYVGQTRHSVRERFYGHLHKSREPKPKLPVHKWMKKYGGGVEWRVMCEVPLDALDDVEVSVIRRFRKSGRADLNVMRGGSSSGVPSENSSTAVLSPDKVQRIKLLLHKGNPPATVARWFQVASTTISNINTGRTWKRVPWPSGERVPTRTSQLKSQQLSRRVHTEAEKAKRRKGVSDSWTPERKMSWSARVGGTNNPTNKYSEAQIREVKERLWSWETPKAVSKITGVSLGTVNAISSDAQWKDVPWPDTPRPKKDLYYRARQLASLSDDQVRNIRKLFSTGNYTRASLAREIGLGVSLVENIVKGRSYQWVE